MRVFLLAACSVALCQTSHASTPSENQARDAASSNGLSKWLNRFTRKSISPRQSSGTCYEDDYYYFVYNSTFGEQFCQAYMHYPNYTVVEDYTPTSVVYDVFTTITVTKSSLVRVTPGTTVVVTSTMANLNKRAPEVTSMPRGLSGSQVNEVFQRFRRQNSMNSDVSSASLAAMSASFSSACSCQTYSGVTITETYTDQPEYVTISGYDATTTTVFSTTTARRTTTATSTVIVTAGTLQTPSPAGSPSSTVVAASSASSSNPIPTAPPFTCPEDHNTTVSQMVRDERFDYQVLCDYDIADPTFFGSLYYTTFGQCVAACSVANKQFEAPVCQGASYFNAVNNQSYNCFLKTGSNGTTPAVGVNSGVLLRIAVGVRANGTGGTAIESAPFTSETDSGSMSSVMSSMMSNSTTSMPMITPGPSSIAPGSTHYSTYILNGSTYSSGTVFSTYYTSNGSWYYSYFTSYTLNWASATTEYIISETGTSVANSSSGTISQNSDANGGYSIISDTNTTTFYDGGYNVTEVVSNQTFNANGSQIASTATTMFFSFTDSPRVANISVSVFSTQTIISNGGSGGGSSATAGSGAIATPPPTASATAGSGSGGTAYSSGFFASGAVNASAMATGGGGGTAFSSGFFLSGAITSTATSSALLLTGGGSAFSSGTAASGALTFTDSGVPRGGTGLPSPYGPPASNTHRPYPMWTPQPYMDTEAPRSGSEETTSSSIPLFTGPAYQPFSNSGIGRGTGATTTTTSNIPLFTGPSYAMFTNTGAPRAGTGSTVTTSTPRSTGTAVSSSASIPLFTGRSYSPFSNTDAPRQGSDSSSCAPTYLGTTTVFQTTTVFGCYSYCAPTGGGHHSGPQSFGPPHW